VDVEGVGDHGCEYMTAGKAIILGETGRNFAAGMTGGIAYVYDRGRKLIERCNLNMVVLEHMDEMNEQQEVYAMLEQHVLHTDSKLAKQLLESWQQEVQFFVKVIPKDYKRMLEQLDRAELRGLSDEAAALTAFEANKRELIRTMSF